MSIAFADAARPARFTILRLQMLDYSLGHELLLLAKRNPILSDVTIFESLPITEQIQSVIEAALICCQTWKQNQKPHKWLRLWGWMIRNQDFKKAAIDFREYRERGSSFPIFTDKAIAGNNDKGRTLGGPYQARLLNFAQSTYGESAIDMPLGFLHYLYFSQIEYEGNSLIENADERNTREQLQSKTEEILKDQAARKEAACQP